MGSSITDGEQRDEPPPGKLDVKTGPLLAHILIFRILWFSVRCCLRFSGYFQFILASIDMHNMRIHYHFLTFSLSVGHGGLQLIFPPYHKPPVTPLVMGGC